MMPITAMMDTTPPRVGLLPYREAMKSAMEVMCWVLLMRMIFLSTNQPRAIIRVGPIYMVRKLGPEATARPTLP